MYVLGYTIKFVCIDCTAVTNAVKHIHDDMIYLISFVTVCKACTSTSHCIFHKPIGKVDEWRSPYRQKPLLRAKKDGDAALMPLADLSHQRYMLCQVAETRTRIRER